MADRNTEETIVYWCTPSVGWIRVESPYPVLKSFLRDRDPLSEYQRCPSVREGLKNTFALRATNDFDFRDTESAGISTSILDTRFFNEMFRIRSKKDRLYSIQYTYIMLAEEDDLNLQYTPAYLEDTEFCNTTTLVPGLLNIGKYFRATDCAFHLKKGVTGVHIKEGDPYAYVNFLTDKKVVFKQFRLTPKLKELHNDVVGVKENRCPAYKPLSWYYSNFKRAGLKKAVMKEIRENLCE